MITIRPSIFCFFGKLASDLQAMVPMAIRRRLGTIPDVFSFVSVGEDGVDLRIGTFRPKLPIVEGPLVQRAWSAISFSAAAIGNIRVRTDALRRPAEGTETFQIARGGPDIYLVQCLSDPMGWELVFSIAEKIHERNDVPPSAGRSRGLFPLFHLPFGDEDAERRQAVTGLRRLESLVARGVLYPSIVLDRVNRNGYPLEHWEDLTELLSDFLALGSASEAAGDIWRVFPQVADLHGSVSDGEDETAGLSSMGLARFRFNKDLVAEELGRWYTRDVKRTLASTFDADTGKPGGDDCRTFLESLISQGLSANVDGLKRAEAEIVEWVRGHHPSRSPGLGVWAGALDRLQKAIFERLGDVAQHIENARQEGEVLAMESPLRDTWIARLSAEVPPHRAYVAFGLGGAVIGSFLGLIASGVLLKWYLFGGVLGAAAGLAMVYFFRQRWTKEIFTLGEFPESAFTQGFSAPRTLERFSRQQQPSLRKSGISIQLWGELRTQAEPGARERIEGEKKRLDEALVKLRTEEQELIFLDRGINALRECVETWRSRLSEVETWEPGRGFSGDVFPADGSRRIYEWFLGRKVAEDTAAALLPEADPAGGPASLLEMAERAAEGWGRERVGELELQQVLEILDDQPQNLLERLSEASAPLWPRPGDRDELVRCFGEDFQWLAKPTDLRHSIRDETIFIRVLGRIKSRELART